MQKYEMLQSAQQHAEVCTIDKVMFQRIYDPATSASECAAIIKRLGSLQDIFAAFMENERKTQACDKRTLQTLFAECSDASKSAEALSSTLHALAPGNGSIGSQEVNFLADLLRTQVADFLNSKGQFAALSAHEHAFGSGGDLKKTIHATTSACIIAAPEVPICKTGTLNVTSHHGSSQAMKAIGYRDVAFDVVSVNEQLSKFHFAFISLAALGFPYSQHLRTARRRLWNEAFEMLNHRQAVSKQAWQHVVRNTPVPLDIFKIISPNAQVLSPQRHSTGVCHPTMIPYVIGLYFHLNSTGMIVFSYDGIDEISNASTKLAPGSFNTVVIQVASDHVTIATFAPEDLGIERVTIEAIAEAEDINDETDIMWRVLRGQEKGAKRDFILVNAGLLIAAHRQNDCPGTDLMSQMRDGIATAHELIDSGRALSNFQDLLSWRERTLQG